MLVKYTYFSGASGKIGGSVASHNRFGDYMRRWKKPVNPQSTAQVVARAALSYASALWRTLTDSDRQAWDTYAAGVPMVNRLGEVKQAKGFNWYVAGLGLRHVLAPGVDTYDGNLPATATRAVLTPVTATADASDDEVSVSYVNTDQWSTETGGLLGIWVYPPRDATKIFPTGGVALLSTVAGNTSTPPTGPLVVAIPGTARAGDLITVIARCITRDNRISAQQILNIVVSA